MVERPMIRADETMPIEEHMNFAVHPGYNTSTMWMTICDNYMVEAKGVSDSCARPRRRFSKWTRTVLMPRLLILLTLPPATSATTTRRG